MMKQMLLFVLLAFSTLPTTVSAKDIHLEVKGVSVGVAYKTVLRQLGKPLSKKIGGSNPCGNTKMILRYSGLIIKLDDDGSGRNFSVISIEAVSPKWIVAPKISVGVALEKVRAKFGGAEKPVKESGLERLSYFISDGFANFYFRNKKLVKIIWEENLC